MCCTLPDVLHEVAAPSLPHVQLCSLRQPGGSRDGLVTRGPGSSWFS